MTAPLSPKSYRDVDISLDNGPLVQAIFSETGPNLLPVQYDQRFVPVAGRHPYPLSPQPLQKQLLLDVRLAISVDGTGGGEIEEFLGLFDGGLGEQTLVATDGTIDWEIQASVLRLEHANGVLNRWTVTLQATDGVWRKSTDSLDLNTASAVTSLALVASALGNQRAPLIVEATPTIVKGQASDQIHGRQVVIAWKAPVAGLNYPIAIQMDTATETTANMLANGNDIAVVVDNVIVQRDLGTMDAAVTNIWFVADWAPARSATLKAAMTAISPATGADWDLGLLADTTSLPDSGVLLIGTEAIYYTSKDPNGHTLKTITRRVRNTTAAIHAIADVAYYVEHDIWLVYGHSAATAPTIDSDRTPQFDRSILSNNTQWTYNASSGFATEDGRRPGEWYPTLLDPVGNPNLVALRGKYVAPAATYLPSGVGAYATQNGTIVGAATRHEAVDDPVGTPDDDTTYVQLTAVSHVFTVATAVAVPRGSLVQVRVYARAKADIGGVKYRVGVVYGTVFTVDATGELTAGNAAYANANATFPEYPPSDLIWPADALETLQIGAIAVTMGAAAYLRITQLYLELEGILVADPAPALGIYYSPDGAQPGMPNRDSWTLDTPCGIVGKDSITVLRGGGNSINTSVVQFKVRGTDGHIYLLVSGGAGGTAQTGTYSPAGPSTQLIMQHDQHAAPLLWDGVHLDGATIKFDPDYTPSVVVGAAQSVYVHRWTVTQESDADKALTVLFVSPLNKKLTVDTDTGAVTFEDAGRLGLSALSLSTQRRDWLELLAGENDLAWSDPTNGAGVLAVNLRWKDRRI